MTSAEALAAIRQAFAQGRYYLGAHASGRMSQRRVSRADIVRCATTAARAEMFSDAQRAVLPGGTTSWRVFGTDIEGDELVIGVDLTLDHLGYSVLVVTVF